MRRRGTVFQRKDRGSWTAKLLVEGKYTTKSGFSTKAMAERWLESRLLEVERADALGVPYIRKNKTLAAILPKWEASLRARSLARSTVESYVSIATRILKPRFGKKLLSKITPADIENLLESRAAEGAAPGTLNRYRTALSSIFEFARRQKEVATNPAREVKQAKEELPPIRYLTE